MVFTPLWYLRHDLRYGDPLPLVNPVPGNSSQLPIDHHHEFVPVHNLSAANVPPQGLNVPQFTCDFCPRIFSQRYELKYVVLDFLLINLMANITSL